MLKSTKNIKPAAPAKAARKATKVAAKEVATVNKVAEKIVKALTSGNAKGAGLPTGKIGEVFAMLKRKRGVTVAQIVAAIGWQRPGAGHTLSTIRGVGHEIESDKAEGQDRVYRLA
jgi:hypothetical protein